ncbi:MAG: hypothetical protein AAGF86_17300, partial [Pseudomonadota bacterium]
MAPATGTLSRFFLFASFLALLVLPFDTARAEEAKQLPEHVIKKFGKPPAIPDGPLSKDLANAVKMAFIDSTTNSTWGRDQTIALSEVADSKDPRLVWMIGDMMRFISSHELNAALTNAAVKLLGIEFPRVNQWGIVTDHLIAWDIPA